MKTAEAPASLAGNVLPANSVHVDRYKLGACGLVFVLLTVAIFWYQFSSAQTADQAPSWEQLQWGYLLLILLYLPAETLASGARIWVLCRVLQPGTSLWTCIKAEWANVAVSMLTPSQTGGGPAQIYILSRAGVSTATAITISLLSFIGTMAGLACMGVYSLTVTGISAVGPLYVTAVWTLIAIGAALTLAALSPDLFRVALGKVSRIIWRIGGRRNPLSDWWPSGHERFGEPVDRLGRYTAKIVDLVYGYCDDVRRFLRVGKASFVWVCLLSVVFLLSRCFIPYLCIRFLGITASSFRAIFGAQMALTFLVFFVPTPGSAGLAEAASMAILSEIVPIGFVPYYNLLWRFSTLYIAAIAGFACLLQALAKDRGRLVRNSNRASINWRKHL